MVKILDITLKSQVRGGKNNMGVTRTGIHYPNTEFKKWRDTTVWEIISQRPKEFKPIDSLEYYWEFNYTPIDYRRRDAPAILDAVFHCLERANIVTDDRFIKYFKFIENIPDKNNPKFNIEVYNKL